MKRTSFGFATLQVTDADLVGVNIIAFRRLNQMDLSGNVITAQEHVATLKASFCNNRNHSEDGTWLVGMDELCHIDTESKTSSWAAHSICELTHIA